MSPKQIIKVRNNSIILFFAQAFSLVLNIFSISLAARYLGVEDFGQFNYYLAIVGVGAKILDFGFNPIIFRELSQKGNEGKYLGSVLIFRISIYLLVIIVIALLGILFNYDYLKLTLILILFINVFFPINLQT